MKKLLAILLVCAMVFSFTGAVFAADEAPAAAKVVIENGTLQQYPNCNNININDITGNPNLVVAKKGNKDADAWVIWTAEAIDESVKADLVAAIKEATLLDKNGSVKETQDDLKKENLSVDSVFVNGNNTFTFNDGNSTMTVVADPFTISFTVTSDWSWFYYGNYNINEKEYVWEKVGNGDSATGMGTKISAKNQWFMYNTGAGTFDIQAGNPKNGENFVGKYTVESLGDNKYVIIDNASNDGDELNPPTSADDTLTVISGAKFWVNKTGKFETSPGNQKGKATLVEAGEVFTVDGPLYVFAHFNVDYYVAQEVETEVAPQ